MAEVKVFLKNSIPSLSRLIVNYRKERINKLLEFTTAKSKEYGIIPKSSTVVADLRVTSSTSRKFFKKIYTHMLKWRRIFSAICGISVIRKNFLSIRDQLED